MLEGVVATIDHLLLAALAHRHLPLRHVGAASRRTVIVDEVHDADPYMLHLLRRALTWLGAAGVPVVLLSATVGGDGDIDNSSTSSLSRDCSECAIHRSWPRRRVAVSSQPRGEAVSIRRIVR